jgi:hypothetical protein
MTDLERISIYRSASRVFMASASCLSFALLLVAGTANAGITVVQAHPFKVGGAIYSQGVSEKTGDDILEKDKFNEKLLGANCAFLDKLDKTQRVILVLNEACGGDINNNSIQVVETDPFFVLATIGAVDFDDGSAIFVQKKGVDRSVAVPATVQLACSGTIDVDVEASAIATIKFDKEGNCVQTVKMKNGSGTGTVDGIDVILDKIKADAKKHAASILNPGS